MKGALIVPTGEVGLALDSLQRTRGAGSCRAGWGRALPREESRQKLKLERSGMNLLVTVKDVTLGGHSAPTDPAARHVYLGLASMKTS